MKIFDRVRVATATTGQGTLTLGASVSSNFFTLAEAGAVDGDEAIFVIEESGNIEIATGVVGDSATTITRATVYRSKIAGTAGTAKIELGGSASVYFVDSAFFLNSLEGRAGFLQKMLELVKTGNYTITTADKGVPLVGNSASPLSFALPPVAESNGEYYFVRNIGAGVLTIDPNAAEQIEGVATFGIPTGGCMEIWPNEGKTAWRGQFSAPLQLEIHGATAKATPVDADELGLWDSVSSGLRKLTWANIKTMLLWATITNAATAKTTPIDADLFSIVDTAAANVIKKLTWANLKATMLAYLGTTLVTPWVAYTPTFTAFGTVSNVAIRSRRVGDTLHIRGKFTAGTVTAAEARMTIGFNGTSANVTSDATKVPSIQLAGLTIRDTTGASTFVMLIEGGLNIMTFGAQATSTAGLAKQNASAIFASGADISIQAEIPITGW